ncbi:MAG: Cof-type HAD-IIB family hydrolase [Candidatus Dormibacteria bacterium]
MADAAVGTTPPRRTASAGPFKLLALDIDGTLVDRSLKVTPANLAALQEAMHAGVRVVLATGRMFRSAVPYARQIGTDEPVIAYQGAVVRRPDGTLLREWPLSPAAAQEAVRVARRLDLHLNLYADDRFFVERMGWAAELYASVAQVEPVLVGDLMEVAATGSTKAVFVDRHPRLAELEGAVRGALEPASRVTFSMPEFLEVVDRGLSKALALEFVCAGYGIRRDEVIAAGDGPNDREMFEYCGLAVAPRDAIPEVLAAADVTMAPPGEDGIAELVHRFLSRGGANL